MKYRVPFIRPSFPSAEEISADYAQIVKNNWFTNFGPFEQTFRNKAAEFIGDGVTACTVANATLGLDIAVKAVFEGRGRKVIVPSFTFAAGPEVLISNGYTPVLIDINDSIQPDITQATGYIAKHRDEMAGVLLCNTFGTGNTEITDWEELCKDYGLPLIIDSAAGFGSEYKEGARVGSRGDCEVFSFHATKPFAVGEGGLVTSRNEAVIQKCRELQNFGFGTDRHIEHIGTNAKMQEINSAIGIRQLGDFATRLTARRVTLGEYKHSLSPLGFEFQKNDDLSTVAFATSVAPTAEVADRVLKDLVQHGVEARKYYYPLHREAKLGQLCIIADGGLGKTDDIADRVVSLPVHDHMHKDDIEHVVSVISQGLKNE